MAGHYPLPQPRADHDYPVYDAQLSAQRTNIFGYHYKVSSKSPRQIKKEWVQTKNRLTNRPSRAEYMNGDHRASIGMYTNSNVLLTHANDGGSLAPENLPDDIRGTFFCWMPYGKSIGEMLAIDGFKTLESFAAADPQGWAAMSNSVTIHNFSAQAFHGAADGVAFLALNPEYSVHSIGSGTLAAGTCEKLAKARIVKIITQIHNQCGPTEPFWVTDLAGVTNTNNMTANPMLAIMPTFYSEEAVKLVRSLPNVLDLERSMATLQPSQQLAYRPYTQTALDGLFKLLCSLNDRRDKIQVLHFVNIPLLDRRMVAIILRACPKVSMIGIYDCPLIHFGDVICLLDLINEINVSREADNEYPISKFDFFPHFNQGMPYDHPAAETYGITWSGMTTEFAHRGIFRILLEAYIKARSMGIELLFEEDKAFRRYLSQLPLLPLAVERFFTGLERHREAGFVYNGIDFSNFDADFTARTRLAKWEAHEGMYDALKAVRLGVENICRDWPHWYGHVMGANLVFCSSCGHEMVEEFFLEASRGARPETRVCAGCLLRKQMDGEVNHQRQDVLRTLTILFEAWNGYEFNKDAPLEYGLDAMFRLKSTGTVRAPGPLMYVNVNGHLAQPHHMHALVRDNKIHKDSLQNLPTLEGLLHANTEGLRTRAMHHAMVVDVERVTIQLLGNSYRGKQDGIRRYGATRVDRARPNHDDEGQRSPRGVNPFGFGIASIIWSAADRMGF